MQENFRMFGVSIPDHERFTGEGKAYRKAIHRREEPNAHQAFHIQEQSDGEFAAQDHVAPDPADPL